MIFGLTPPERFAMGVRVALGRHLRRVGDERPSRTVKTVKWKTTCIHSQTLWTAGCSRGERQAGRFAQPSGLKMRSVAAGYLRSFSGGRRGRDTNSPPQLGHRRPKTPSAHERQNVHSKEHMTASVESGGRSRSQHSQLGRSWSTGRPPSGVRRGALGGQTG